MTLLSRRKRNKGKEEKEKERRLGSQLVIKLKELFSFRRNQAKERK